MRVKIVNDTSTFYICISAKDNGTSIHLIYFEIRKLMHLKTTLNVIP